MIEITDIPHILAVINSITVILLLAGFYFIRYGDFGRHRLMMLSALVAAALFLGFYVYYHANAGLAKFGGQGIIRPIYFTILIAHVIGAIALTPMVPMLVYRALKKRYDGHKRLARWTFPLWLYVSVSGVVIYFMAIHIYPFSV